METITKPLIEVTVVYIADNIQKVRSIVCASGTTLKQAITLSNIQQEIVDIPLDNVGVFSEKKPLDYQVTNGDRIEIYRPLVITPTEARRLRAASKNN